MGRRRGTGASPRQQGQAQEQQVLSQGHTREVGSSLAHGEQASTQASVSLLQGDRCQAQRRGSERGQWDTRLDLRQKPRKSPSRGGAGPASTGGLQ